MCDFTKENHDWETVLVIYTMIKKLLKNAGNLGILGEAKIYFFTT